MGKKSIREIISVIFKAVTLAMGVAVVVLSCLGSLEAQTSVTCWALAWPARASLCWQSRNGTRQINVRRRLTC